MQGFAISAAKRLNQALGRPREVVAPHSWFLREGWSRAGPIHLDEVPGPGLEP
jgi:hypothetical protein